MAKISTYPIISTPTLDDLLIGTDVNDSNITKNFTIGEISGLIGQGYIPYIGANSNVNLGSFNITASSFIIPGGLPSQFVKADGTLDSTVYTPQTRTITINGTTYNLSANRSWNLNTIDTLTTIGNSGPATYSGNVLNIPVYQTQGSYITQLSGEATAVGPGNATVTLSNSAVISKVLTGLNVTGGTVVSTDTILQAFGKIQNQINGIASGVEYQGTWNASTNTPFLQSSVGTQGHYYVVSVSGNTNLNGITDWKVGDWAIYNGSAWDKVDNTDAVVSVNGYTGAVVLTASDVGSVPTTRTLTINGVGYDLSLDRSWTVGDVRTDGSYANPSWISSLAWSKITGTPTTLAGYGITDAISSSRTLTINGVSYDLSANRTWNVGTVTSVGTSGPLTGGTITGSGTIGITQAGSSSDGYLSSTDWSEFNSKQSAISVNAPLTFVSGVIGITQSGTSTDGYLSSTDWNTFNNKVSGSGTAYKLPMWSGPSSLSDSPLSYLSDTFTFEYNSSTGGTVIFTNIGLTTYTYSIQMNNFGSPRSTVHNYTDGLVIQSIGSTQTSRMFANGNFILGAGISDTGHKLTISGDLYVDTISNATTDTNKFIVSDGGVIKYRTGSEILSDIGAQGSITLTTTGSSGAATLIGNTLNIPNYSSSISGYVPYTGATQNVNLGEFGLTSGFLGFDLTPTATPTTVGTMYWDTAYRTASLITGTGATTLQIGQEEVLLVHNNTGSALTDGQVVYVTGSTGELPSVSLADASSETTSAATLGVVTESIANGANGFVTVSGIVHGLNTLAYTEGDIIWLSETAGQFTNVKPVSPAHLVLIGYVIKRAGGNGSILVKIQNTQELSESSDVLISTPKVDGQGLFLQTIGAIQLWRNRSIPDVLGYTPANSATTITINGTAQDLSSNRTWSVGTVISVGLTSSTSGVTVGSSPIIVSGNITLDIATASGIQQGLLAASDWTTFNGKQNAIILTTTGSSGSASLIESTLNIPSYTLSGLGGVPISRILTINGVSYDLSADRSWTVSGGLSGSGTTNYLPKFTGSTSVGNSIVFDNGTNVSIGATSTNGRLGVRGTTNDSSAYAFEAANSSGNTLFIVRNDGLSTFAGNVGINTYSPSTPLHIVTPTGVNFQTAIRFEKAGGFGETNLQNYYTSGSNYGFGIDVAGTTRAVVNNSGFVGIGTTSPLVALHVVGQILSTSSISGTTISGTTLRSTGGPSAGGVQFGTSSTTSGLINYNSTLAGSYIFDNRIAGAATSTYYQFRADSTPILTMTKEGNIGLNTATPFANPGFTVLTLDNNTVGGLGAMLLFQTAATIDGFLYATGGNTTLGSTLQLAFQSGGAIQATITSSGAFLIGSSYPAWGAKLEVAGTIATDPIFYAGTYYGAGAFKISDTYYDTTLGILAIKIEINGSVYTMPIYAI